MEKEKVRSILERKVNEVVRSFEKVNKKMDRKSIQEFRTGIKDLRSFLRLLNMEANNPASDIPGENLKIPKKFRELYFIAGIINETLLELEWLSERKEKPVNHIDAQQDFIRQQKIKWAKYPSKKMIYRLKRKFLGVENGLGAQTLVYYFKGKLINIDEKSRGDLVTDTNLHAIRKQLRDVFYTWKTAKKEWEEVYWYLLDVPVKKIKFLYDRIGKYNDKVVAFDQLDEYADSLGEDDDELKIIKRLCKKIEGSLEKDKKELLHMTRDLTRTIRQEGGARD